MTHWIYVDNSNVFIEGKRLSAVKTGLVANITEANNNNVFDNGYRIDFGKLNQLIIGPNPGVISAKLFGSRPPHNDAIWNIASRAGFDVTTVDRNSANKEKKLDTGIVAAMVRDACKSGEAGDLFTIVSGDNDYVPAVQIVKDEGFQVNVVFWKHAGRELRDCASAFVPLDDHLNALRLI